MGTKNNKKVRFNKPRLLCYEFQNSYITLGYPGETIMNKGFTFVLMLMAALIGTYFLPISASCMVYIGLLCHKERLFKNKIDFGIDGKTNTDNEAQNEESIKSSTKVNEDQNIKVDEKINGTDTELNGVVQMETVSLSVSRLKNSKMNHEKISGISKKLEKDIFVKYPIIMMISATTQ